jgi:hypothetical protein
VQNLLIWALIGGTLNILFLADSIPPYISLSLLGIGLGSTMLCVLFLARKHRLDLLRDRTWNFGWILLGFSSPLLLLYWVYDLVATLTTLLVPAFICGVNERREDRARQARYRK